MSYIYQPFGYHHCPGCRCYDNSGSTWTFTTAPTYQPKHRKPGPAQ